MTGRTPPSLIWKTGRYGTGFSITDARNVGRKSSERFAVYAIAARTLIFPRAVSSYLPSSASQTRVDIAGMSSSNPTAYGHILSGESRTPSPWSSAWRLPPHKALPLSAMNKKPDILKDICRYCGKPIANWMTGEGWKHVAGTGQHVWMISLGELCRPNRLNSVGKMMQSAPAGRCIVVKEEEAYPVPKSVVKRLRPRQSILICSKCYRPQPTVHARGIRICICCGNKGKEWKQFRSIAIPMGVSYVWSEQRISRGNEVLL